MRVRPALASLALAPLAGALLLAGPARAEAPRDARALVLELLELSGGTDMMEQLTQLMIVSLQQSYAPMMEEFIASQPELSEAERTALRETFAQRERIMARFAFELPQRLRWDELVDKVYVPVYTRHFTAEDLAAIVAFYRTPAGEKALRVMPALVQESMEASLPVLQPVVMSLTEEILLDEMARALE